MREEGICNQVQWMRTIQLAEGLQQLPKKQKPPEQTPLQVKQVLGIRSEGTCFRPQPWEQFYAKLCESARHLMMLTTQCPTSQPLSGSPYCVLNGQV